MIVKWANRALLFVNVALALFAVWYLSSRGLYKPRFENIEYKDLITIVLTALAVILAAVTIFVAALAIWGYSAIREAAIKAAEVAATDTAKSVAAREVLGARALKKLAAGPVATSMRAEEFMLDALKGGGENDKRG